MRCCHPAGGPVGGWWPPWSVAPGTRSIGQVLHHRHDQHRFATRFEPPLNRASRCPSDPTRRPTAAHATGRPPTPDGRPSTARLPQCSQRPSAACRISHTVAAVTLQSGGPDIRRERFAVFAFSRHHCNRCCTVVDARNCAHDVYRSGGRAASSTSGSGATGMGYALPASPGPARAATPRRTRAARPASAPHASAPHPPWSTTTATT